MEQKATLILLSDHHDQLKDFDVKSLMLLVIAEISEFTNDLTG
jgi:hypothetical protein